MPFGLSGYTRVETHSGQALVRCGSSRWISAIDGIIFDVDGVLIDVRESIQLAHGIVAERYFGMLGWVNCTGMVTPEDVDNFKLARGFNSDWDLANAWVLLYLLKSTRYQSTDGAQLSGMPPTLADFASEVAERGGGLENARKVLQELSSPEEWQKVLAWQDRALLERIFKETYSGDLCPEVYGFQASVPGPGLIWGDKCLLDRGRVPKDLKLGVATGRTLGETIVGLRLVGLSDLFPVSSCVTEDDGLWKPDPAVLRLAVDRTGCRYPMYVGDTPDDLATVENYRSIGGDVVSCAVLTGLQGQDLEKLFALQGADLIADNVNTALDVVAKIKGEM